MKKGETEGREIKNRKWEKVIKNKKHMHNKGEKGRMKKEKLTKGNKRGTEDKLLTHELLAFTLSYLMVAHQ
jgi:hypothetical protein